MTNYNSFQEVMDSATREAYSISAMVGTQKVLMTHGGLTSSVAQQFHEAVRKEYERQESEGNTKHVPKASAGDDTGGGREGTGEHEGVSSDGEEDEQTLEEILQGRLTTALHREELLQGTLRDMEKDLASTQHTIEQLEAALNVVKDISQ